MSHLITIIHHDPAVLNLMGELLKGKGFRVSGDPAEKAYEHILQQKPDLVILDMPFEHPDPLWLLLDLLRLNPATTQTPIVLCSAGSDLLREKEERLRQQRCLVLEKPFELPELLGSIEQLLAAQVRR